MYSTTSTSKFQAANSKLLSSEYPVGEADSVRHVEKVGLHAYTSLRAKMFFVTASRETVRVEKEIDERVKALYRL